MGTCKYGLEASIRKPPTARWVWRWVLNPHNEEQDVKEKIMVVVGAYIFLIAAAQALPTFFSIDIQTFRTVKGKDRRYSDYPLSKGPQRSLEFMGIQGRYTYWAAGVAGGAIVGFIIAYCFAGPVVGLVTLVAVVSTGIALIMLKQRKELHTKKDGREVYIYTHSKKLWEEKENHHGQRTALLNVERGPATRNPGGPAFFIVF